MANSVEFIVGLKVPDNTAITALQALWKLGYEKIREINRADYYKFLIDEDVDKFREKISKVDILVNANKHFFEFSLQKNASIRILVKNTNNEGIGLLAILKKRLGFKNIANLEKGVLWSLKIDANENDARKIAERACKELLVNEHYQEYLILG
jgi:phosphoribosylformylglycinamidine (FGAM) synthase PurS component